MITIIKSMADHDTLLKSANPVMICFKATWCAPCKTITPFLEEFATNNIWADVATVDIDTNPDLVKKYDILKLPTTMFFMNGVAVGESTFGVITKAEMEMRLRPLAPMVIPPIFGGLPPHLPTV